MRKKLFAKTAFMTVIFTAMKSILTYFNRRVLFVFLGEQVLGIGGLFSSIISGLSIMELGVGYAINYTLYQPLEEGDNDRVTAIMRLYTKLYTATGILIMIVGLLLIPVLSVLVRTDLDFSFVTRVYCIYIANTSTTYFLSSYRGVLIADQREYINLLLDTLMQILMQITQMALVALTLNYELYSWAMVAFNLAANGLICIVCLHRYPYLKKKSIQPLDRQYVDKLITNVKSLFMSSVSTFLVFGTDNLLLTQASGLTAVAIYGNYTLIFNAINGVTSQLFNKMTAGVGNFAIKHDHQAVMQLFYRILFLNFVVVGGSSVCFFNCFNQFIGDIWLSEKMIWPIGLVALLVYNNYSRSILNATAVYRGAFGVFSPYPFYKYLALVEGGINLLVSALFIWGFHWGTYGVFAGTAVSNLVSTVISPQTVYRYIFKASSKRYWRRYSLYLGVTMLACLMAKVLSSVSSFQNAYLCFLQNLLISVVSFVILVMLLFHKSDEYQYYVSIIKGAIKL